MNDTPANRYTKLLVLGAAAIVLVTLLAYLPAIHATYIWDDDSYVTENTLLHDFDGLRRIWIPRETPQYYPMVFSTFWVEYQLWELNPMGYHIVNILLHAFSSLLLWLVMVRLRVPGAWLIAAVFALHPICVESVAWITERKNVLSLFFYLIAAIAYLKFDALRFGGPGHAISPPEQRAQPWGWYGLALIAFMLALFSKTVTCSLPAALILVMLWQRSPITLKRLAPLAPMFMIGFALAMITVFIERAHVGAEGEEFAYSFVERCMIAARSLLFYPWKIIWPAELMFIYPRWKISASDAVNYIPIAIVLLIGAALVELYRRGWRGPFVALSFYAGTVFPAIGFFNVYPHLFSFVADHFVYHASIGVIAFVIGGTAYFIRKPVALRLIGAVILPVLFMLTYMQSTIYYNEETVWRDTIAKNPDAWMPRNNLASRLLEQAESALLSGNIDHSRELAAEALEHASEALRVREHHHTAHSNKSEALRLLGDYEAAIHSIEQAITHAGHLPDYHWQKSRLHQLLEQFDEAVDAMSEAVERAPESVYYRLEYARILSVAGRLEQAAEQFEAVLEIQPNNFMALGSLAGIAQQRGNDVRARLLYTQAIDVARTIEEQLQIVTRLIRLLATSTDPNVRDFDEAINLAEQVAALSQRQDPSALAMLASVYLNAGRPDDAVAVAEEAIILARSRGMHELAMQIEQQLEVFRSEQ